MVVEMELMVCGKKDDRVQELVTAVVVLKPDQEKKVNIEFWLIFIFQCQLLN